MLSDQWTKEEAIARMEADPLVAECLRIEPRLKPILDEAIAQKAYKGYDRVRTYYDLKARAYHLVGFEAAKPELRTYQHYDAFLSAMEWMLPPDEGDEPTAEDEDGGSHAE